MAYVKLPEEIRRVRLRRPDGPPAILVFSVFAGEVSMMTGPAGSESLVTDLRADPDPRNRVEEPTPKAAAKRRGAAAKPPKPQEAHRLWIRSRRSEQGFEFHSLPITFHPGDVAAVAAVMPPKRKDGPIVAAANVDRNEKVDFVGREEQLLKYLSGYSRDYRRRRAWIAAWSRAIGFGLLVGAAGLAAAAVFWPYDAPWRVGGGFVEALLAGDPTTLGPASLGAAVTAVAILHGLIKATLRIGRRARFQKRLLQAVWSGAADALGFVQDHANAFRLRQPEALPSTPAARRRRPARQNGLETAPTWNGAGLAGLGGVSTVPAFLGERGD